MYSCKVLHMEANLISVSIFISSLFLFLLIYKLCHWSCYLNLLLPLRLIIVKTNFHWVFMNFCVRGRGKKWWFCYCGYGNYYLCPPWMIWLDLPECTFHWRERYRQWFFESLCLTNRFGPWMTRDSDPWRQLHQQAGVISSSLAERQPAPAAEPSNAEGHSWSLLLQVVLYNFVQCCIK